MDRIDELETAHSLVHSERNHYREVYERCCDDMATLQKEKAALLIQLGNSKAAANRATQRRGASTALGHSFATSNSCSPSSSPETYKTCARSDSLSGSLRPSNGGHASTVPVDTHTGSVSNSERVAVLERLEKERHAWRRKYERSRRKAEDWKAVAKGLVSQRLSHSYLSDTGSRDIDNGSPTSQVLHASSTVSALDTLNDDSKDRVLYSPGFVVPPIHKRD